VGHQAEAEAAVLFLGASRTFMEVIPPGGMGLYGFLIDPFQAGLACAVKMDKGDFLAIHLRDLQLPVDPGSTIEAELRVQMIEECQV
jgi:hypothetical protein